MRHFCSLVAPTRGCCGTNQQSITSPQRRRRLKCKAPVQYRSAERIHSQLNWPSLEMKVECDAGNYIKYLDNMFRFKHTLELDVCGLNVCLNITIIQSGCCVKLYKLRYAYSHSYFAHEQVTRRFSLRLYDNMRPGPRLDWLDTATGTAYTTACSATLES